MASTELVTLYLRVLPPPEEDDFGPVMEFEGIETFGTFGQCRGGLLFPETQTDATFVCCDCSDEKDTHNRCDGHIIEDSILSCGVYDFVDELPKEVRDAIYRVEPPARIKISLREWITESHTDMGHECDAGYSDVTYEVLPL